MNNDDIYKDIDWNIGKQIKDFLPLPAELINAETKITSEERLQSSDKHMIASKNTHVKRNSGDGRFIGVKSGKSSASFFHSFTVSRACGQIFFVRSVKRIFMRIKENFAFIVALWTKNFLQIIVKIRHAH